MKSNKALTNLLALFGYNIYLNKNKTMSIADSLDGMDGYYLNFPIDKAEESLEDAVTSLNLLEGY